MAPPPPLQNSTQKEGEYRHDFSVTITRSENRCGRIKSRTSHLEQSKEISQNWDQKILMPGFTAIAKVLFLEG